MIIPREKDIVKFFIDGKKFAGTVVYVTEYDTVNILPFTTDRIWSVSVDRIDAVLTGDTSKLTLEALREFLSDAGEIVRRNGKIVKIPPRPRQH